MPINDPLKILGTGALTILLVLASSAVATAGSEPITDPDSGRSYLWIDTGDGMTFDEQVALAESTTYMGVAGHLVTVTSAEEEAFLESNFPIGSVRYYIGGTDEGSEGQWYWITGEPWGFASWGPGEPNGGTNENCIEYQPVGVAQWNDITCNGSVPDILIEFEPEGVPTTPMGVLAALLAGLLFGSWIGFSRKTRQQQ
jgi:hypothetical protein